MAGVCYQQIAAEPRPTFLRILMLNFGVQQISGEISKTETRKVMPQNDNEQPILAWRILSVRMVARAIRGLISFRPTKEYAWLQARLENNERKTSH